MRPVFLLLPFMIFCLGACAHEAENTGVENSSVFTLPATNYAFETPVANTLSNGVRDGASYVPGKISRFQRNVIVIDDTPSNPMPSAQYFDDVMDHLEMLMADKIRENNKIAVLQEKIPGYEF